MADLEFLNVKYLDLSEEQIADRLEGVILKVRQRKIDAARVAANALSPWRPEEWLSEEAIKAAADDRASVGHPDEVKISRRSKRIYSARLKASGLAHLKVEDRKRLMDVAGGLRMAKIRSEHHADEIAAALHDDMPWMAPATEAVWRAARHSVRNGDGWFRLPPIILDGPPGIGKTRWAGRLSGHIDMLIPTNR